MVKSGKHTVRLLLARRAGSSTVSDAVLPGYTVFSVHDAHVAVNRMGRRTIMRTFAALLVLVGHCFVSHTAAAAQSQDCKLCREDYAACVKAHTQGACKTNYDICMNHCRKK
jgi:hypothetical protein